MHTKRTDTLRESRLACSAALIAGAGTTAVALLGIEWDGSAVAPLVAVAGLVGLVRLRPTAAGRRARARARREAVAA